MIADTCWQVRHRFGLFTWLHTISILGEPVNTEQSMDEKNYSLWWLISWNKCTYGFMYDSMRFTMNAIRLDGSFASEKQLMDFTKVCSISQLVIHMGFFYTIQSSLYEWCRHIYWHIGSVESHSSHMFWLTRSLEIDTCFCNKFP